MENRFEEKYCQLNDDGLKDFEDQLFGMYLKGDVLPIEKDWFEGILLEKYANNEWDEAQKSEIEKKLFMDADLMDLLKKSLKSTQMLMHLKDENKIRYLIREQLKHATFPTSDDDNLQIEKSTTPIFRITNWLQSGWPVFAAAFILLFLGLAIVFLYHQKPVTSEELFADFYFPEEPDFVVTRDNSDENLILSLVQQAYFQNDTDRAIRLLMVLSDKYPSRWAYLMNLGILQMNTGDYEAAVTSFNQINADLQTPVFDKVLWNLGLCYLKTGKIVEAQKVFSRLSFSTTFYAKKAEKVLTRMKKMKTGLFD